jgi:hypothetical protein
LTMRPSIPVSIARSVKSFAGHPSSNRRAAAS